MDPKFLFAGSAISVMVAAGMGLTNTGQPSAFVAAGIVLLAMGFASANKR